MSHRRDPSFFRLPFVLAAFAAALAAQGGGDQPAAASKAAPVFADGEAQVVDAFKDRKEWIREWLFVQADFDSDGDGKKDRLHVDVTRPKQTATEGLKVPVVYETSPYFAGTGPMDTSYYWSIEQELGQPPQPRPAMAPIGFGKKPGMISQSEVQKWLPRGFAVVHSCSPGTGFSQGCPTIGGPNEALAPKMVIDWLCGRAKAYKTLDGDEEVTADWCSGKVGMVGTSYNGTLPIAAATTGVEGLAAVIPIAPAASWYGYYRSNGLVRSPGGYPGEDMDVLFDFVASGDPKRRSWCIETMRDGELKKGIDRTTGDYNEFWAARDYKNQLGKWQAATLMAHGFNDWNVMPEQSVSIYAMLKQKGVPCMAFFHQSGHVDNVPFKLQNRWFTRFLHGVDNGVEKDPKAWIVREDARPSGATPYADYPNPEAAPVTLWPMKGGNAVGALAFAAATGQGKETIVDDPKQAGAALAQAEKSDNRLLFALPKFTAPVHVSGTPRVTLRLACNKPATNLSVWLVSLPWQGGRKITDDVVTRGWADPQNRSSLTKGEPLKPGQFYDVSFDLQPDDQILAAGEQLALMVMASDNEFTLHPKAGAKLTIDLDSCSLVVPVVGGEQALRAAVGAGK